MNMIETIVFFEESDEFIAGAIRCCLDLIPILSWEFQ
jgi:hypothetical protein